jgi:hypothetical protein
MLFNGLGFYGGRRRDWNPLVWGIGGVWAAWWVTGTREGADPAGPASNRPARPPLPKWIGPKIGYDPEVTPVEFPDADAISAYVSRVTAPDKADWSVVSPYYNQVNYGPLIGCGQAVLINACPYRSKKISAESENKRLLERLPSTQFTREWLLATIIPLAESGQRLVIAKRPGL